jgi:ribonucleoside-diphosphate reductase alpha chain
LRTLAATSAEKSTGQGGELNAVSSSGGASTSRMATSGKAAPLQTATPTPSYTVEEPDAGKFCSIDNPDCEACQ